MVLKNRVGSIVKSIHQLIKICYPNFSAKIAYLTIFAKDNSDYNNLIEDLSKLGAKQETNNGFKFVLTKPLIIENEMIQLVRIRKPDIHRKEEGCADVQFENKTYKELRKIAIKKGMDVIVRKTFEMIELSTFDINVYAYVVNNFA